MLSGAATDHFDASSRGGGNLTAGNVMVTEALPVSIFGSNSMELLIE